MKVYCIQNSSSSTSETHIPVESGKTYTATNEKEFNDGIGFDGIFYQLQERNPSSYYNSNLFIPLDDISIEELTEILEQVEV